MKELLTKEIKDRLIKLNQFPKENVSPTIDPIIPTRFIKDGIWYYPIAIDEEKNEICCYHPNATDLEMPEWISVEKLEKTSLFGKKVERDESFTELRHSNIDIEKPHNFLERLYLTHKESKEHDKTFEIEEEKEKETFHHNNEQDDNELSR